MDSNVIVYASKDIQVETVRFHLVVLMESMEFSAWIMVQLQVLLGTVSAFVPMDIVEWDVSRQMHVSLDRMEFNVTMEVL
jgi:predicted nucleic acid-binding protein